MFLQYQLVNYPPFMALNSHLFWSCSENGCSILTSATLAGETVTLHNLYDRCYHQGCVDFFINIHPSSLTTDVEFHEENWMQLLQGLLQFLHTFLCCCHFIWRKLQFLFIYLQSEFIANVLKSKKPLYVIPQENFLVLLFVGFGE